MLRNVHLHGALAEQFQPLYVLDVETPAEAIHAIITQVKGFDQALRAGEFVCIRGDLETGLGCDEDLLLLKLGSVRDFHLMPAAVGAGRGGGKILLGIALIGLTIVTGGAAAAIGFGGGAFGGAGFLGLTAGAAALAGQVALGVGALLVLSGTAQAVSAMAKANPDNTSTDSKSAFVFNGAINTSQQGGTCPLVFGRIEAGSVIVSAGATAERVSEVVGDTQIPGASGSINFVMPQEV